MGGPLVHSPEAMGFRCAGRSWPQPGRRLLTACGSPGPTAGKAHVVLSRLTVVTMVLEPAMDENIRWMH